MRLMKSEWNGTVKNWNNVKTESTRTHTSFTRTLGINRQFRFVDKITEIERTVKSRLEQETEFTEKNI